MNVERIKEKIKYYNIDSLYIEKDNQVLINIDNYHNLHEMRSISKVLVSIAVGIAIDKKLLTLNAKVYDLIGHLINVTNQNNLPKIKKWTIKNLLTHTTGYDKMLLTSNSMINENTLLNDILNYNINNEVGTFCYNNIEPFLISVIFKEYLNIDLEIFIKENIFDKIGIKEYRWEKFGKYTKGCTGLYLYPEDFIKIGRIFLYKNHIVSKEWLDEMLKCQIETSDYYKEERVFPKGGYGYYMSISKKGYTFKDGANGQYLILNKKDNILITITACVKDAPQVTEILRSEI